jgi:hypothetical protein
MPILASALQIKHFPFSAFYWIGQIPIPTVLLSADHLGLWFPWASGFTFAASSHTLAGGRQTSPSAHLAKAFPPYIQSRSSLVFLFSLAADSPPSHAQTIRLTKRHN